MAQQDERALKITEGPGHEVRSKMLLQTLFLVFITVVFLIPSRPADTQILEEPSAHQAAFVLTIEDELISLDAKAASLKVILEEIGHRMNIQVKVETPAVPKVTLAFERLPLSEVLQRLGNYVNYGYMEHWEQGKLSISTIMVHSLKVPAFPAGSGVDASEAREDGRRAAPPRKALELEIDPRRYLQEKRQ